LQAIANTLHIYDAIIPVLQKGLANTNAKQIIDLASGGGGGWLSLADKIIEELPGVTIKLTDYYPNVDAFIQTKQKFPQLFDYSVESVDATDVDPGLTGLRTQFLSFHHFKPEQAKRILQNAVDAGQPIAVFEALERDAKHFAIIQGLPLSAFAITPFIQPFSADRLFYTYIIPAVPFFIGFDGFVSVCRVYSQEEMREMTASLNNTSSFEWEIGKMKKGPVTIQYLLGYPKK
jgi:hypothetical protein